MSRALRIQLDQAFRDLATHYTNIDTAHIDWVVQQSGWTDEQIAVTTKSAATNPPQEMGEKGAAEFFKKYLKGEYLRGEIETPELDELEKAVLEKLAPLNVREGFGVTASNFLADLGEGKFPRAAIMPAGK